MGLIRSCVFLLLIVNSIAHAETVKLGFDPEDSGPFSVGANFSVDIIGNYTADDLILGGSVDLIFDSSVVNITNVTVNPEVSDVASEVGTIDNSIATGGSIDLIGFATFVGVADDFTIATIDAEAVGVGTTSLTLGDPDNPVFQWTSSDNLPVMLEFQEGSVSVIPLPAAGWFMFSALLTLRFFARKAQPGKNVG
jgi:hypothetical protein